jgi:hypothetical protein
MIAPIRIHPMDTEAEVRARHAQIEARLEELGADQVRSMLGHGLPEGWGPIVLAWLKGDRLQKDA